jgi:phosphoribosylanthranilate isomerase
MVRIKICGITREKDAFAAADAGADALGFVFFEHSSRNVAPEIAAGIIKQLPPFVTTVGVFVNPSREEVEAIVSKTGIGVIQFHGTESPADTTGYSRPGIKAFRFNAENPLPVIADWPTAAILVDTGVPNQWGGTGIPLDWSELRRQLDEQPPAARRKLILAGGLNPANVAKAISIIQPSAVDVSSGVEISPGKKDSVKIKEFIYAARSLGSHNGA